MTSQADPPLPGVWNPPDHAHATAVLRALWRQQSTLDRQMIAVAFLAAGNPSCADPQLAVFADDLLGLTRWSPPWYYYATPLLGPWEGAPEDWDRRVDQLDPNPDAAVLSMFALFALRAVVGDTALIAVFDRCGDHPQFPVLFRGIVRRLLHGHMTYETFYSGFPNKFCRSPQWEPGTGQPGESARLAYLYSAVDTAQEHWATLAGVEELPSSLHVSVADGLIRSMITALPDPPDAPYPGRPVGVY